MALYADGAHDLTGQKFGRWTPICRVRGRDGARWLCRCECGVEKEVLARSLKGGVSKSCGCMGSPRRTCHGLSGEALHGVWSGMRGRCRNPNNPRYRHYGGKGVKVCPEWAEYPPFREWALANGYQPNLTIERRDVNGDYRPGNCTWATKAEQNRNTSRNLKAPSGELWIHVAAKNGISEPAFRSRVNRRGWPYEQAATLPPKSQWRPAC